ncbi:MAG: O-antigen ligase family protein [Candidatus Cloacimonetes bacterium]|nr:O-antigen ligase family protein [Candidatus Cloacimonadota bacterium]
MTESISHLKYIVFFSTLFIGVPISYYLAQKFQIVERLVFFLMMFFTVRMEDINFISRESFRLTSRGFEIGLVDICTFVIFLLILKRRHQFHLHLPPGTWLYFTYFLLSFISIVNAAVPLFSYFELWKMLRMFFYFYVVYNYVNSYKQFNDFMRGVAAITIFIFIEVMKQKYLEGRFQSFGPFPHQNSLVMFSIILGSLMFAFLLNKKDISFMRFSSWVLFFAMTSISIISTLSRAGLVLYVFAIGLILGLSFLSGITSKKVIITVLLIIVSLAILAKAWNSISERFRTAPEESANVRKDLAVAAVKMANDKFLGVGLNNFGVKINPPWQYSNHIEMHNPDDEDEQNGLVETIYLMIAAESGWHTLFAFLVFIFYFYFLNIKNLLRYKGTDYQYFSIGLAGGLLAIYLESTLEWVLKQTNNFYQLMLIFAMIGVMTKLEKRYQAHKMKIPSNDSKAIRITQSRGHYAG